MKHLLARVWKVSDGITLKTETTVKSNIRGAVSSILNNIPLQAAMEEVMMHLGGAPFEIADADYARQIQGTLEPNAILRTFDKAGVDCRDDYPLLDSVTPKDNIQENFVGSTDIADVSWMYRLCKRGSPLTP